MEDLPIYDLIKQAEEKDVKILFGMHNSLWQNCPDIGQSTGSFVLWSQGGTVDYTLSVPSPVAMSSAEVECNSGALAGVALPHIWML